MPAPAAPPATSVAASIEDLVTAYIAGSPTGSVYLYIDANPAAGAGVDMTAVAGKLAHTPVTAVPKTIPQLITLLQAGSPTGTVYPYYDTGAPSGPGVAMTVAAPAVLAAFGPPVHNYPTQQVVTTKNTDVYAGPSFASRQGQILEGTNLVIAQHIVTAKQQRWSQIADGAHAGHYIRRDAVKSPGALLA